MDIVAAVGRLAPAAACELLCGCAEAAYGRLAALVAGDGATLAGLPPQVDASTEAGAMFEELLWVAVLGGHLLADEGRGELPTVPVLLNLTSRAAYKAWVATSGGVAAAGPLSRSDLSRVCPVTRLATTLFSIVDWTAGSHTVVAHDSPGGPTVPSTSAPLASALCVMANRIQRTYLMPEPAREHEVPLSAVFDLIYGAEPVGDEAAAAATVLPNGMLLLPSMTPAIYGGGRAMVELLLRAGIALVCGLGPTEAEVAGDGLKLLRGLVHNARAVRAIVNSPTWATMVNVLPHLISGTTVPPTAVVVSDVVTGLLVHMPRLQAGMQAALLSHALAATRSLGSESPYHDAATSKGVLVQRDEETGQEVAPIEGVATIGERWRAYSQGLTAPLVGRLVEVVQAGDFTSAPRSPPTAALLYNVLKVLAASLVATHMLPAPWRVDSAVLVLQACERVVEVFRAEDLAAAAALEYVKTYVVEISSCADEAQTATACSTITRVFETYTRYHAAVAPHVKAGSEAALTMVDNLTSLLHVLRAMVEQEDILLGFGHAGSGEQGASSAEASIATLTATTVTTGLACVMPLMSTAVLEVLPLFQLYVSVVCSLFTQHAAQVVQLEPTLFTALWDSVDMSLRAPDESVVTPALEAVTALASYHFNCRRAGSGPGLQGVLEYMPDLWARMLGPTLATVTTPPVTPRELRPAANAVLAIAVADPSAFHSAITAMLSSAGATSAAADVAPRLEAALTALATTNGVTFDSLAKANVGRFVTNFAAFVETVRSLVKVV